MLRLLALILLLALAPGPALASTLYYFSSTLGSDANNCTSTGTPCASIAKLNSLTYGAGDLIQLRVCDNFVTPVGVKLLGANSGYGTQNVTSGVVTVGVWATGAETCTENVGGQQLSTLTVTAPETVGVMIANNPGVAAFLRVFGTNPAALNFQAGYGVLITNNNASTSISAAVVDGVWTKGFATGVKVEAFLGTASGVLLEYIWATQDGPTVTADMGIWVRGSSVVNPIVHSNITENIGGRPATDPSGYYQGGSGNGILVADGVTGAHVYWNIDKNGGRNANSCGGPVGIWAYDSDTNLFEFNEVYGRGPTTWSNNACDQGGLGFDNGVRNSTAQFNWSHNNWGPGFYALAGASNPGRGVLSTGNVFRYNLAEGNATSAQAAANGNCFVVGNSAGNTGAVIQFYNNTCHDLNSVAGYNLSIEGNFGGGLLIANNVFLSTGNGGHITTSGFNAVTATMAGNSYFNQSATGTPSLFNWNNVNYTSVAAWLAATSQGAAVVTNPKMTALSGGGCDQTIPPPNPTTCPIAYRLQAGSPAYGAGVNLSAPPYSLSLPATDRYGKSVPNGGSGTGYNIGAWSGVP